MPSLCSSIDSCEAARSRSSGLAVPRVLRFFGLFLRGLTRIFSRTYGKIALMKGKALSIILVVLALLLSGFSPAHASEVKVSAKKTAKPIPSPSPKWPPSGFKGKDGVYAKVPSSKELVGLLSAQRKLQPNAKQCETTACGAVIVASETGCAWWEVSSKVFRTNIEDPSIEKLGSLTTYAPGSSKKTQATIFLISGEKLTPEVFLSQIKVTCHRSTDEVQKPGNTYLPYATPSPVASN